MAVNPRRSSLRVAALILVIAISPPSSSHEQPIALNETQHREILSYLAEEWVYEFSERYAELDRKKLTAALQSVDRHFTVSAIPSKRKTQYGIRMSRLAEPIVVYGLSGSALWVDSLFGPLELVSLNGRRVSHSTQLDVEHGNATGLDHPRLTVRQNGRDREIILSPWQEPLHSALRTVQRDGPNMRVLRILAFDYGATSKFVVSQLTQMLEADPQAPIVIDLRVNAGGALLEALDLSLSLVSKGQRLAVLQIGRDKTVEIRSKRDPDLVIDAPILVLVSGHTASAAEILARLLKQHLNGQIVGMPTYGKCDAQQIRRISGDVEVRFTATLVELEDMPCEGKPITPDIVYPEILLHDSAKILSEIAPEPAANLNWQNDENPPSPHYRPNNFLILED